jgi:hypothetical protein
VPLLAAAVLILALGACTGAPPEATRARGSLVYVDDLDLNAVYESLVVTVHVQDADGIDDIETIHVTHDASGLVWSFTDGAWHRLRESGVEVFVLAGLVTPDGSPLPRGRYRVLPVDAAGHSAAVAMRLTTDPVSRSTLSFPELVVNGETVSVSGPFPLTLVRGYGGDGRQTGELRLSAGEERALSDVPWLTSPEAPLEVYLTAVDPQTGNEVMRGPYRR